MKNIRSRVFGAGHNLGVVLAALIAGFTIPQIQLIRTCHASRWPCTPEFLSSSHCRGKADSQLLHFPDHSRSAFEVPRFRTEVDTIPRRSVAIPATYQIPGLSRARLALRSHCVHARQQTDSSGSRQSGSQNLLGSYQILAGP